VLEPFLFTFSQTLFRTANLSASSTVDAGLVTFAGCSRSLLCDTDFYEMHPFRAVLPLVLSEQLDAAVEAAASASRLIGLLHVAARLPVGFLTSKAASKLTRKIIRLERTHVVSLASDPSSLSAACELLAAFRAAAHQLSISVVQPEISALVKRVPGMLQTLEEVGAFITSPTLSFSEAVRLTASMTSLLGKQAADNGSLLCSVLSFCADEPATRASGAASCRVGIGLGVLAAFADSSIPISLTCSPALRKWRQYAFREASGLMRASPSQSAPFLQLLGAIGASLELAPPTSDDDAIYADVASLLHAVWLLPLGDSPDVRHALRFSRTAFLLLQQRDSLANEAHTLLLGVLRRVLKSRLPDSSTAAVLQTAAVLFKCADSGQRCTLENALVVAVQTAAVADDVSSASVEELRASLLLLAELIACASHDARVDGERCLAAGMAVASLVGRFDADSGVGEVLVRRVVHV